MPTSLIKLESWDYQVTKEVNDKLSLFDTILERDRHKDRH